MKPVLVIGDSLTVGMRQYLQSIPGVEIHAEYGMVLKWGLQWLKPARVVVWALGSNNDGLTPHHMRRYIDAVDQHTDKIVVPTMRKAPPWPNVQDFSAVNTYLRRYEPRVKVADWAKWIAAHPEHKGDGCHPDDTGYRARALLVHQALHELGVK